MDFEHTPEQNQLRAAAAALGRRFGHGYFVDKARAGALPEELWAEAGRLGFLGPHIPTEYGGGGAGLTELAIVAEELAAAGCPLGMLVASPAVVATILCRNGEPEQQRAHLPGLADGTLTAAFAITEPEAGSNVHRISTTAVRSGADYLLSGQKVFVSGLAGASHVLIVARRPEELRGSLRPILFLAPTGTPGLSWSTMDMELVAPEGHYLLTIDDARVPADAVLGGPDAGLPALFAGLNPERIVVASIGVGIARYALERASSYAASRSVWGRPIGTHQGVAHPLAHAAIQTELARLMVAKAATEYDAGLPALFAGLNPERITVAAMGCGTARYALERASSYAATRSVWGRSIGAHQGVAHPLAHAHIQVELARLMVAKAAALYDAGRDLEAGVAANMAKYASSEASSLAVDSAIQAHGGNGMTTEYGVATLLGGVRAGRIAPVSREMILSFVAQHLLGLEKSY